MIKTKKDYGFVARPLPAADIQKLLFKIGRTLKAARQKRTTLDRFSYEINISRTQMGKYESGHNMLLSTFLKVLHGLDISTEEFFRELEKPGR